MYDGKRQTSCTVSKCLWCFWDQKEGRNYSFPFILDTNSRPLWQMCLYIRVESFERFFWTTGLIWFDRWPLPQILVLDRMLFLNPALFFHVFGMVRENEPLHCWQMLASISLEQSDASCLPTNRNENIQGREEEAFLRCHQVNAWTEGLHSVTSDCSDSYESAF